MSTSLLNSILDTVREDFGFPAGLERALEEDTSRRTSLEAKRSSISLDDVIPWHNPVRSQLGMSPGIVNGWRETHGSYGHTTAVIPALGSLGITVSDENWECDISAVEGLAASRHGLSQFQTLEELVKQNAPELIATVSHEALQTNLAHSQIRILNQPNTSDCFVVHSWDKRLFLSNAGGSHHFAAAQYIARRLAVPVPIRGRRVQHLVHHSAARQLYAEYDTFAMSFEATFQGAFFDAMRNVRATWFHTPMSGPLSDSQVVLLPRNEPRSVRVAKLLREAGFADFGRHLLNLPHFKH